MRKTLLLFIIGFCCLLQVKGSEARASDSLSKDSIPKIGPDQTLGFGVRKNTVWLNVGQLGFMESQISFERQTTPDVAIEGTVGFKLPKHLGEPYIISMRSIGPGYYFDYIAWVPFSAGLLTNLAVKKYFDPQKEFYISGGFFYRYWLFNHQRLGSSDMDSQSENNFRTTKQSLRMHVSGFKLLSGYTLNSFQFSGNKNLLIDIYVGVGFRKKLVLTTYDLPANLSPATPELRRSGAVSVHIGLKAGLNF